MLQFSRISHTKIFTKADVQILTKRRLVETSPKKDTTLLCGPRCLCLPLNIQTSLKRGGAILHPETTVPTGTFRVIKRCTRVRFLKICWADKIAKIFDRQHAEKTQRHPAKLRPRCRVHLHQGPRTRLSPGQKIKKDNRHKRRQACPKKGPLLPHIFATVTQRHRNNVRGTAVSLQDRSLEVQDTVSVREVQLRWIAHNIDLIGPGGDQIFVRE